MNRELSKQHEGKRIIFKRHTPVLELGLWGATHALRQCGSYLVDGTKSLLELRRWIENIQPITLFCSISVDFNYGALRGAFHKYI